MSDYSYADDAESVYEGGRAPSGANALKRSFTVESSSGGFKGGRFRGLQPLGAAKKAARSVMDSNKSDSCTLVLRETTRGSDKKEYAYNARRAKLSTPKSRTLPDGTVLTQTHEIDVKSKK
jgi:hypothetical protein